MDIFNNSIDDRFPAENEEFLKKSFSYIIGFLVTNNDTKSFTPSVNESRKCATTIITDSNKMCGSRKYPYPHHGGNWKFRRGGGVKRPGNSRGKGG